jgi:hypothetical protein
VALVHGEVEFGVGFGGQAVVGNTIILGIDVFSI